MRDLEFEAHYNSIFWGYLKGTKKKRKQRKFKYPKDQTNSLQQIIHFDIQ